MADDVMIDGNEERAKEAVTPSTPPKITNNEKKSEKKRKLPSLSTTKKMRHNSVQPLPPQKQQQQSYQDEEEDGNQNCTNGYVKLKDIEDGRKRPKLPVENNASKLMKHNAAASGNGTKKKQSNKVKFNMNDGDAIAASKKKLADTNSYNNHREYGTYGQDREPSLGQLPDTARLPPLNSSHSVNDFV